MDLRSTPVQQRERVRSPDPRLALQNAKRARAPCAPQLPLIGRARSCRVPRAACRAGGSTGAVGLPVRRKHGNVVALPGHAGAPDRPTAYSLDDDAKDAYLKSCCRSL